MKCSYQALSLALLVATGAAFNTSAVAEPIYEHTDEAGVANFSDTPTPASHQVEVNPNVVEVAPVVMPDPLPEREDKNYSTAPRPPELPEIDEGGDNYYYDDGIYKRRRLIQERDPENRPVRPVQPIAPGTPVHRPAQPVARPAVR